MKRGTERAKAISEILLAAGAAVGFLGGFAVLGWFLMVEMPTGRAVGEMIEDHLEADPGDHSGKVPRIGFSAGVVVWQRQLLAMAAGSVTIFLVVSGEVLCDLGKVSRRPRMKLHLVALCGLLFCLVVVVWTWVART